MSLHLHLNTHLYTHAQTYLFIYLLAHKQRILGKIHTNVYIMVNPQICPVALVIHMNKIVINEYRMGRAGGREREAVMALSQCDQLCWRVPPSLCGSAAQSHLVSKAVHGGHCVCVCVMLRGKQKESIPTV